MKTKYVMSSLAVILALFSASAQQVDYNKIIPVGVTPAANLEDHLVQLAWRNNPTSSMAKNEVEIAQYNLRTVKTEWGTQFGVNGNLNEFTIKAFQGSPDPLGRSGFYPRYNVYLHVPLASFIQRPNQRKAAEARVAQAQDQINLLKLELRARVLKLYSEYKKNKYVLEVRKEALKEEETYLTLVEKKFEDGSISVQDYMLAQKSRTEQKILTANAENFYNQSRLDLEEIIGVKVEEVPGLK